MESNDTNYGRQQPAPRSAITPVTMGLAGGLAGSIASTVLKQNSPKKHLGSVVAGIVVGAGAGALLGSKQQQAATDPFGDLVDYQEFNRKFSGFSGHDTLGDQEADAFFHFADAVAKSGKYGALQTVFQELYHKGQADAATTLHHYLAEHYDTDFVRSIDAWLTELAERSPETLQHVQRQAVLMAMLASEAYGNLPVEERNFMVNRALIAGISHDVGKLAISPELLHKSARVDHGVLANILNDYAQNVPDYPEKAAHIEFMQMVNGGRIAFGEVKDNVSHLLSVDDVIDKVTREPLLGEPDFADDQMKASNAQIYSNIKEKASAAGLMIPAQVERDLLNYGKRGTLTKQEIKLMEAHDNLGVAMLDKVGLPVDLGLSTAVVNMDKSVHPSQLPQDLAQLRQWVKLTDMFEATTGQRAYNRENGKNLTPNEAVQLLDDAAKSGAVDAGVLQQFKDSGVTETYANLYDDIPKTRDIHHPQPVVTAKAAELQQTVNQASEINRY